MHRVLLNFYTVLIALRKNFSLCGASPTVRWDSARLVLGVEYRNVGLLAVFNFSEAPARFEIFELYRGGLLMNSEDSRWSEVEGTEQRVERSWVQNGEDFPLGRRSLAVFASNASP